MSQGLSLRATPGHAIAAATAFLLLALAPFPYEPEAEGGRRCYCTPRRPAPEVKGTSFEPRLQMTYLVAAPPRCATCSCTSLNKNREYGNKLRGNDQYFEGDSIPNDTSSAAQAA